MTHARHLILLVASALLWACSCDDPADGNDAAVTDAGPEAGPEASVQRDAGPEAAVADARVYPDCDVPLLPHAEIIPGELYRLPPTGESEIDSVSWDGRYVVYTQGRCSLDSLWGYDVYQFDIQTMQESVVAARYGTQRSPKVWDTSVIFVDSSYLLDPPPDNDQRFELFLYNIPSGEATRITDGNWAKIEPAFNGTHVAYLSTEWDPDAIYYDFVLREIETGQEIVLADHNQSVQRCYDITDDYVTWMAMSPSQPSTWDIFYHHIPTGITDRLHLDTANLFCSSISGNQVAWNEARSGYWDVYVMDLDTGIEEQITNEPADQELRHIGGHLVTWFDYRHAGCSLPCVWRDLYLHDLESGITRRLTLDSLRWGTLKPISCRWLVYAEIVQDQRPLLYAWDLVAAGVLDSDCHVIPCDPETEDCAIIEWQGL